MSELNEPFVIHPDNANQILGWMTEGRGLAHWTSIDLGDPSYAVTTPGDVTDRPHWKLSNEPAFRIFDIGQVLVGKYELFRRFHVGIRAASNGLAMKVTDGGTRRIRKALMAAGPDSFYQFDYDVQDVLIYKQVGTTSLTKWAEETAHDSMRQFVEEDR